MEPVRQAADPVPVSDFSSSGLNGSDRSASQARQRSTALFPAMTAFPALPALKMARGGIEPPTRGFSVLCSAN